MKKYYRNRHASFLKALNSKKQEEQQAQEELRLKEERKKKKIREKVLAQLNQPNMLVLDQDASADIDDFSQRKP